MIKNLWISSVPYKIVFATTCNAIYHLNFETHIKKKVDAIVIESYWFLYVQHGIIDVAVLSFCDSFELLPNVFPYWDWNSWNAENMLRSKIQDNGNNTSNVN